MISKETYIEILKTTAKTKESKSNAFEYKVFPGDEQIIIDIYERKLVKTTILTMEQLNQSSREVIDLCAAALAK